MSPVNFPEANTHFGPPPGYTVEQVQIVPAFVGKILMGSLDGAEAIVVAWKPDAQDLKAIVQGSPVFLICVGGLPAHALATEGQFRMSGGG